MVAFVVQLCKRKIRSCSIYRIFLCLLLFVFLINTSIVLLFETTTNNNNQVESIDNKKDPNQNNQVEQLQNNNQYHKKQQFHHDAQAHHQQQQQQLLQLPPLDALIGDFDENILVNTTAAAKNNARIIDSLLDFAVIGFGKCGTTSLNEWLGEHPHVHTMPQELWYLQNHQPARLVRRLYRAKQYQLDRANNTAISLLGYKNPTEIRSYDSLRYIQAHFPSSKLILAIRHPVYWFRSLYDYYRYEKKNAISNNTNSRLLQQILHDDDSKNSKKHYLSLSKGEFHVFLALLGKTNLTQEDEVRLLLSSFIEETTSDHPDFLAISEQQQQSQQQLFGKPSSFVTDNNSAPTTLRKEKSVIWNHYYKNNNNNQQQRNQEDHNKGNTAIPRPLLRLPNPVFLLELSQLSSDDDIDANNRTSDNHNRLLQFRKDFSNFIFDNNNHPHHDNANNHHDNASSSMFLLPPPKHVRPSGSGGRPNQQQKKQQQASSSIQNSELCRSDEFRPVRRRLMEIAKRSSLWIGRYFIHHPTVVVSPSKEVFQRMLLEEWNKDPCRRQQ